MCRELDSPAPYLVAATTAFKKNQNRKNEDRDGGGGGPRAVVALTAPLMVMMTTVGAFQSASPIKKTLQGGAAITWEGACQRHCDLFFITLIHISCPRPRTHSCMDACISNMILVMLILLLHTTSVRILRPVLYHFLAIT